ncbi:conserved hypothetical protein [Bacillus subtilis subsp. subtilis str. RO-NN-1]|nr:conserved hypothetical protein [Bacillus subtilis subsp. subtilis str. RO-NN-1]
MVVCSVQRLLFNFDFSENKSRSYHFTMDGKQIATTIPPVFLFNVLESVSGKDDRV